MSLYVRKRDKRCVTCGSHSNLQAGHLFSRVAYNTRWNDLNVFAQCAGCNLSHEYNTFPLTNYFLNQFGQGLYQEMYRDWHAVKKFTNKELESLYLELQELYKLLE